MIRFFHTADLHLGRAFSDLGHLWPEEREILLQANERSFKRLVDEAVEEKIDFLLVAGDIYDIEDRSIASQIFFNQQMERLKEVDIPVYIIHGNHDSLKYDHAFLKNPDNVHVFPKEIETVFLMTKNKERVALTGFSYPERWVFDPILRNYPKKSAESDYHIGLYHGSLVNENQEDPYAPFTKRDIQAIGYDYLALGHIHKGQQVTARPPAYYSGSLQGLSQKETGPKGYLDVVLEKDQADVVFIPSQEVLWENISVDLRQTQSLNRALAQSIEEIQRNDQAQGYLLLNINFIVAEETENYFSLENLFSALKEETRSKAYIINKYTHHLSPETSSLPEYLLDILEKAKDRLTAEDIEKLAEPLLDKHREDLDMEAVKDQALNLILRKW